VEKKMITALILTAAVAGSLDADLKALAAIAGDPAIVAAAASPATKRRF